MQSQPLLQTHVGTMQDYLSRDQFEDAYKIYDDIDTSFTLNSCNRSEEMLLEMSRIVLQKFLSSPLSDEKKIHLCERTILHLSNSQVGWETLSIFTLLFEKACLETDVSTQIKCLSLILKISSVFTQSPKGNQNLALVRDELADITQECYLNDIYEVAIGKDIDQKLKSGDLERYLQDALSLKTMLGPQRVSELMHIANRKIKTLSQISLCEGENLKVSELILQTGQAAVQLETEEAVLTTSLSELLQERYNKFQEGFRRAFERLGEKRWDPLEVARFQNERFTDFIDFLNQGLLSNTPFFLFKTLPAKEKYLLCAFGSLGRRELCPFSDLEYLILHDSGQDRAPLDQLATILEFEISLLGNRSLEHKEEGLNTPFVYRDGFHLDDLNPVQHPELIAMPNLLVKEQEKELLKMMKFEIPYRYSLIKLSGLTSDSNHPLLSQYQQYIDNYLSQSNQSNALTIGQKTMCYIHKQLVGLFDQQQESHPFPTSYDDSTVIDIKKQLIHPLFVLLESLAIYHSSVSLKNPELQELTRTTNTLDVIKGLVKIGVCTSESGTFLLEVVSALYTTRVRLHLEYDHACDKASFNPTTEKEWVVLTVDECKAFMHAYWLAIIPLYKELKKALLNQNSIALIDLFAPAAVSSWDQLTLEVFGEYAAHKYLKEQHIAFYSQLSNSNLEENRREAFLKGLARGNTPLSLISELSHIPNINGYRQSYRMAYDALYTSIRSMTTLQPEDENNYIQISSPALGKRYLKPEMMGQIINSTSLAGVLQRHYDTLHNVAQASDGIHSLHFKEHPTQPWMDYAICNLYYRLFGHGAFPTEIVKFSVNKNGIQQVHYVEISKTVVGTALKDLDWTKITLNQRKIIELMIGTLIIKPADGRRSNYLAVEEEGSHHLISLDHEASLIDPVIREGYQLHKKNELTVLFKSVLFCYDSLLNMTVNAGSMRAFYGLNITNLLLQWATDVIDAQKKWVEHAFSNSEVAEKVMDALLRNNAEECNLRFLMREGGLFSLFSQMFQLQHYFGQCLRDNSQPKPLELLKQIVGIGIKEMSSPAIGRYIYNEYVRGIKERKEAHERLEFITGGLSEYSRTRSETLAMLLGSIPTKHDMKFSNFSIQNSLKEITNSIGYGGAVMNLNPGEVRNIQANFETMDFKGVTTDIPKQIFLGLLTLIKDIERLDLSHCAFLDDQTLKSILSGSPNLRYLNVSHCPRLKFNDPELLQNLSSVEELDLSHCHGITELHTRNWMKWPTPIRLPKLKKLSIENCTHLNVMMLNASSLEFLEEKRSPKLDIQYLQVPSLKQVNAVNFKRFGKAEWEKHIGDIEEEPPLPTNIFSILSSPCPFWSERIIGETHLLVLIPRTVKGLPLTLENLPTLFNEKGIGCDSLGGFHKHSPNVKLSGTLGGIKNIRPKRTQWILMTTENIPNSHKKTYSEQKDLIAHVHGQYEVPLALEATVCILGEYLRSGTRLFINNTFTRCQEKASVDTLKVHGGPINLLWSLDYHIVVGGFDMSRVRFDIDERSKCAGVAAIRKF